MEYYKVKQSCYINGKLVEPIFPLTDRGMLEMLASGAAEALGHDDNRNYKALFGSAIYGRRGKDDFVVIHDNFDTSG